MKSEFSFSPQLFNNSSFLLLLMLWKYWIWKVRCQLIRGGGQQQHRHGAAGLCNRHRCRLGEVIPQNFSFTGFSQHLQHLPSTPSFRQVSGRRSRSGETDLYLFLKQRLKRRVTTHLSLPSSLENCLSLAGINSRQTWFTATQLYVWPNTWK